MKKVIFIIIAMLSCRAFADECRWQLLSKNDGCASRWFYVTL